MAPEIVAGKHYSGTQIDVWSLGVLLATMIGGSTPFAGAADKEIRRKISRSQYRLADSVTDAARDLIGRMLMVEPRLRISLPDTMSHPWLSQN